MNDEETPLTSSDLLAKIQDLEERLNAVTEEKLNLHSSLNRLEEKLERSESAKIRSLGKGLSEKPEHGALSDPVIHIVKDHEIEDTFPNTTFSFFFVSEYPFCDRKRTTIEEDESKPPSRFSINWNSRNALCIPFWTALVVILAQVSVYGLVLINATDFGNEQDPFLIPANVDSMTRTAEFVAIAVTVYTQTDFFSGLGLIFLNADSVKRTVRGYSRRKQYFGAALQLFVGAFGIFTTFILIVQANEVIDLLLNFTAMEFVANLDDVAFNLAHRGFLWTPNQKTAVVVEESKFVTKKADHWLKQWPHFFTIVALYIWWGIIFTDQVNRKYGDNEIFVQFTDHVIPELGTLSGPYKGMRISGTLNDGVGRVMYTMNTDTDYWKTIGTKQGVFYFCTESQSWTFSVVDHPTSVRCDDWMLRSEMRESLLADEFDLLSHDSATWFANDSGIDREEGVRDSIIMKASYDPRPPNFQKCFQLRAEGIAFDYPFFKTVPNVRIRGRPVFDTHGEQGGEFIAYNGLRWLAIKYRDYGCMSACVGSDRESCIIRCLDNFEPYQGNYTVQLISDPMEMLGLSDTWIPTPELFWHESDGVGSSAYKISEEESMAEAIVEIPQLLKDIADGDVTEEDRAEGQLLFTRSSTLGCMCADADSDGDCDTIIECEEGTSLWIDLKTDDSPIETHVVTTEANGETSFLLDPSVDPNNVTFWITNRTSHFAEMYDSQPFTWQSSRADGSLKPYKTYDYTTCVPKNVCGIVAILEADSGEVDFAEGLTFPGSFGVYLNGKRAVVTPNGFRYCIFQFGSLCKEEGMKCVDYNHASMRKPLHSSSPSAVESMGPSFFPTMPPSSDGPIISTAPSPR